MVALLGWKWYGMLASGSRERVRVTAEGSWQQHPNGYRLMEAEILWAECNPFPTSENCNLRQRRLLENMRYKMLLKVGCKDQEKLAYALFWSQGSSDDHLERCLSLCNATSCGGGLRLVLYSLTSSQGCSLLSPPFVSILFSTSTSPSSPYSSHLRHGYLYKVLVRLSLTNSTTRIKILADICGIWPLHLGNNKFEWFVELFLGDGLRTE